VTGIGEYILGQNYPNPFNQRTAILYSLPEAAVVTLLVYDIQGRVIATLVQNERKAAGNYKIFFDAPKLASGVYIYKLRTVNFESTRKMLFLK
jgi:5-hydroxyisourate hydrolase-like protein (transthyretin family)